MVINIYFYASLDKSSHKIFSVRITNTHAQFAFFIRVNEKQKSHHKTIAALMKYSPTRRRLHLSTLLSLSPSASIMHAAHLLYVSNASLCSFIIVLLKSTVTKNCSTQLSSGVNALTDGGSTTKQYTSRNSNYKVLLEGRCSIA